MMTMRGWGGLFALLATHAGIASAGDVAVRFARFAALGDNVWRVSVTLEHGDTGWEHYADAWRVVTSDGKDLGTRTLHHPHEAEQPFTRSLSPVRIPAGVTVVTVEAHDKVHGWSGDKVLVNLNTASGDRFEVKQ